MELLRIFNANNDRVTNTTIVSNTWLCTSYPRKPKRKKDAPNKNKNALRRFGNKITIKEQSPKKMKRQSINRP
jgi:hypothetical protein